ncbi:MAG: hypothetical protein K0Q79_3476 [Flavipsychrobacter sp.]|nr:hypothetical protein [Flavipsychrobacter sp.]
MILAHNQPQQLLRLIDRLDQSNAWFYIHIDTKSTDKEAIKAQFSGRKNVIIISNHDVNWMGFNMVRSTIDLLRLAYSSGLGFKYYVLLSGQDYPIKSNEFINNFFSTHNEDFISFARINDSPDNYKNKVRYYHYYDFAFSNPRNRKKIPWLVYLYYGIHKRVMKYMPKRRFYKNMEPYFGSQWFAITAETAMCVLDFITMNRGYLRFMKYTEGPDETFFHTIILNSERKSNVYDYNRFAEWNKTRKDGEHFKQEYSSLRYMDWSDRGKDKPKPAILDDSYYEVLAASPDLFARKVDEKISARLMERIDHNLLNGK